jgi:myotubularin-related protein 9
MSKTVSLWSHINRPDVIQSFMNPIYEPNPQVIWPSVHPISLVSCFKEVWGKCKFAVILFRIRSSIQGLWNGMYLRWIVDQSSTKETWTAIADLKENERELKKEAIRLRKYLLEMHQAKSNQNMSGACQQNDRPNSEDSSSDRRPSGGSDSQGGSNHPLRQENASPS